MHIAHIVSSMDENYGGAPRMALGLGPALADLGLEISYWASADPRLRENLLNTGPEAHFGRLARPRSWFRSPEMIRELDRQLDEIDLLHLHEVWSYPQWAAARLARRRNKPYVVIPHGELEPWRVKHKGKLKYIKKKGYLSLVGLKFLNKAACLQAGTLREIEGFRASGYRGPATVVPNGIDPELFRHLPDPRLAEEFWPALNGKKVVLFLSRLNSEKGLDQLIPAWAGLKSRAGY